MTFSISTRYSLLFGRMLRALFCAAAVLMAQTAHAEEPRLLWSYEAESNLYAPPLVADVHEASGLESIISDSEARVVRCISATGELLWTFDGGWSRRLTSRAALSYSAREGQGTLAICGSDGKLACLDAASGTRLWDASPGGITWGAVLWTDLDGDQRDELIAPTESNGIHAFNADGSERWVYRGEDEQHAVLVRGAMAAADVNGDGRPELFAANRWGVLQLNADGTRGWEQFTGDDFNSSVTVADIDMDGRAEVFACSANENALYCFAAADGSLLWKAQLAGGADSYASSAIAVGDLYNTGRREVVVCDSLGYVHCFDYRGQLLWVFSTSKRTQGAVSLGDVDGDEAVEVLVASGDHFLYCLSNDGREEWRYEADLRLLMPATIGDVDLNGATDILFCGSDRILRCVTLDAAYNPDLIPWPSWRVDSAHTGAVFDGRDTAPPVMLETARLFEHGGFEAPMAAGSPDDYPAESGLYEMRRERPAGWTVEGVTTANWRRSDSVFLEGVSALEIVPENEPVVLGTELIALEPGLQTVTARLYGRGKGAEQVLLRWRGASGVLRIDSLPMSGQIDGPGGGQWKAFEIRDVPPPVGAKWINLLCVSAAGDGPVYWDKADIEGHMARPRELRVMVNQVGYDVAAPKKFTAQSNFDAATAIFTIENEAGKAVHTGALTPEGRITGAYGHDWGYTYWRGDFSAFDTPGRYRIRITLDDETDLSWPFEIGENVLWARTSVPAYQFFYYQRCGMAIPGFHGACHLDDATNEAHTEQYGLAGGWHDAGDYNTYHNAPYVYGLSRAYTLLKDQFDEQDTDGNGMADFLDEILWGADHSRRMIAPDGSAYGAITTGYGFWGPPELETDNIPDTGDERPVTGRPTGHDSTYHMAAMARLARFTPDSLPMLEAAAKALNWALERNQWGPMHWGAVLDLYEVTGDEQYAEVAKEYKVAIGLDTIELVEQYDALFGLDHSADIRATLVEAADRLLSLADNPFGVVTNGPAENPNFFGTPADQGGWHVGTSSMLLEAATTAAKAWRYTGDPRYLAFVYDQFNWTLGNNPYDLCLMEGVGDKHAPSYHHRYTFAGVARGAVPGGVVNGITWRAPGDDRPSFDMRGLDVPAFESNEVWLPHNTHYLNALANVMKGKE